MRLGADGLLGEEGLHRVASFSEAQSVSTPAPVQQEEIDPIPQEPAAISDEIKPDTADPEHSEVTEPVLTADELRALLQEQPSMPPSGGSEN